MTGTAPECECAGGCRRDALLGQIHLQLHREEFAVREETRRDARLQIDKLRLERLALRAKCVCLS